MVMFFRKIKNTETLDFLLVKNIGKEFSDLKILFIKDHSS